ncbi:MAG: hypothetical protein ACK41O_08025, partial [Runella zeae]
NYTAQLNGEQWMPGLYFCMMKCDSGQKVIRIVKA